MRSAHSFWYTDHSIYVSMHPSTTHSVLVSPDTIIGDARLKKERNTAKRKRAQAGLPGAWTGALLHDCSGDRCIVSKVPSFFKACQEMSFSDRPFSYAMYKRWILPDFADFSNPGSMNEITGQGSSIMKIIGSSLADL